MGRVKLMLIMLIITISISCTIQEPHMPPSEQFIISEFWEYDISIPYGGQCWYLFEPVDGFLSNCSLKFLYYCDSLINGDTLTIGWDHDIGNAYYVLDSIQPDNSDFIYHFLQERETFEGVYNNNGICNEYVDSNFNFTVRIIADTPVLYNIGDTMFIQKI